MFSIILTGVLIVIAAISNAVMDTLQFHFSQSIFNKWGWGNPRTETWKNKWKLDGEGNITNKERFPLSTSVLVFLTDGWHFFQFLMIVSFLGAVVSYENMSGNTVQLLLELLSMYVLFGATFEVFFSKIFKSNESS